jgi:propanediol utilization protein
MEIIIEECRRHVHLTEHAAQWLFNEPMDYGIKKVLNVGGEIATQARVKLPNGMRATVLKPFRAYDQMEVSESEYREIFGNNVTDRPRASGYHDGARWIEVTGTSNYPWAIPVIIAEPHIHISPRYKGKLESLGGFLQVGDEWYYRLRIGDFELLCRVCWHVTYKDEAYIHLDVDLHKEWNINNVNKAEGAYLD